MDKKCNVKVPKLYIIRGASGVGKSTVLNHLKAQLDDAFLIDIDSVRAKFSRMDWLNGVTEFVNAQKIVRVMVNEVIKLGYGNIIVADPFPIELLKLFLEDISCPIHIISLYCDSEELLRRLEERGRPILHREHIFNLNKVIREYDLDLMDIKADRVIYFDNTHKDECALDIYFQQEK